MIIKLDSIDRRLDFTVDCFIFLYFTWIILNVIVILLLDIVHYNMHFFLHCIMHYLCMYCIYYAIISYIIKFWQVTWYLHVLVTWWVWSRDCVSDLWFSASYVTWIKQFSNRINLRVHSFMCSFIVLNYYSQTAR